MSSATLRDLTASAATLEHDCRWADAEVVYRELFRRAVAESDIEQAVDAARRQAGVCWRQGRSEDAAELAILSCTIAERIGYLAGAARAMNVLAAVHHAGGDLVQAKELYRVAQAMAMDAGNDEVIGLSCQNLGIIANMTGDLREARTLYLEAIASAVRSDTPRTTALVYNNLGIVCADLQEWMEAELYFDRGIEIAEQLDDSTVLVILHANRARPLIQVREFARARTSLAAAAAIAAPLGDTGTLAEVEVYHATIARLEGDLDAAHAYLSQAISLTAENGLERERALALEGLAHLHREQDRHPAAVEQLRRAGEIFHAVGSERDAARVEELLSEWATPAELALAAG